MPVLVRFASTADTVGVSCGDTPSPGSPATAGSPPSPPRGRGLLVGESFARPKSRIFGCPRVVMKMFAGLMSRCVIPFECAASSASAVWIARSSNSLIGSGVPRAPSPVPTTSGHPLPRGEGKPSEDLGSPLPWGEGPGVRGVAIRSRSVCPSSNSMAMNGWPSCSPNS